MLIKPRYLLNRSSNLETLLTNMIKMQRNLSNMVTGKLASSILDTCRRMRSISDGMVFRPLDTYDIPKDRYPWGFGARITMAMVQERLS